MDDIGGDCPFYHKEEENINDLFKFVSRLITCGLLLVSSPQSKQHELYIIDWLEHIWYCKCWYNKIFCNPLEKVITTLWAV